MLGQADGSGCSVVRIVSMASRSVDGNTVDSHGTTKAGVSCAVIASGSADSLPGGSALLRCSARRKRASADRRPPEGGLERGALPGDLRGAFATRYLLSPIPVPAIAEMAVIAVSAVCATDATIPAIATQPSHPEAGGITPTTGIAGCDSGGGQGTTAGGGQGGTLTGGGQGVISGGGETGGITGGKKVGGRGGHFSWNGGILGIAGCDTGLGVGTGGWGTRTGLGPTIGTGVTGGRGTGIGTVVTGGRGTGIGTAVTGGRGTGIGTVVTGGFGTATGTGAGPLVTGGGEGGVVEIGGPTPGGVPTGGTPKSPPSPSGGSKTSSATAWILAVSISESASPWATLV
jgi:hypothetical protein